MSATEVIAMVTALAAFIVAVVAVIKVRPEKKVLEKQEKSLDSDVKVDDSNVALNYQQIAANASAESLKLTNDMKKQRGEFMDEIKTLKTRVAALEKELGDMKDKYDIMEDWNRRLAAQIISLDGVPVPMVPKTRPQGSASIQGD